MFKAIASIFTGGGFKAIENIATEWIETDMEKAEAQTVMLKALDPNGLMRRGLSERVSGLYSLYILVTLALLICEAFALGPMNGDQLAVSIATSKVTDLFTPITTLFGIIVSASFGVNYANTKANK
jgi:hypothetical protein